MIIKDFIEDAAQLICCKCKAVISHDGYTDWFHGTFQDLEQRAYRVSIERPHVCASTPLDLDRARDAMIRIRRKAPELTFEEQCKIYNLILSNQTFPDEVEFKSIMQ